MKKPLTRDELRMVIEGKESAWRIPMLYDLWVHPWAFGEMENEVRKIMQSFVMDACIIPIRMPNTYTAPDDDPEYRWMNCDESEDNKSGGIDERVALKDFELIDEITREFPDPDYAGMYPDIPDDDGRYRLACWFYCLFERHWSLRGMSNALMDFYLYPEQVHKLYDKLTRFYMRLMERAKSEGKADGILTSDDIGTQTGPFFSIEIFRTFFKPYYKRLIEHAHKLGMHFWLHSCGDISLFMEDFIEIELDVIHPVQKYAINEHEFSEKYSSNICVWAGIDVQRVIPFGKPEAVREEVRFIIDTYSKKNGLLMLTAGNGVNQDCPVENLFALYDESYIYGQKEVRGQDNE